MNSARQVFDGMDVLDSVTLNSIISSCTQTGLNEESIVLFINLLKNGIVLEQFTLASILEACSEITRVSSLHEQFHGFCARIGPVYGWLHIDCIDCCLPEEG